MTTRDDYTARFPTTTDAIAFEHGVLTGTDRILLPDDAVAVMDGGDEPTSAYWQFMIDQHEAAELEAERAAQLAEDWAAVRADEAESVFRAMADRGWFK